MQGTANVKLKRHGGWNCSKMNQDTCNCPLVWRGNVWKRYPETLDSFKVYRSSRPNPQTWTFHWDCTPRDLTNLKKLELRDIGSHSKLEDLGVPCQVQLEPLGMWTCCPRPCCPRLLRMQMLSLRPDILQQDTPSSCRFLRAEIYTISINFSFKIVRDSMGKHLHILQCSILQHDYARPLLSASLLMSVHVVRTTMSPLLLSMNLWWLRSAWLLQSTSCRRALHCFHYPMSHAICSSSSDFQAATCSMLVHQAVAVVFVRLF